MKAVADFLRGYFDPEYERAAAINYDADDEDSTCSMATAGTCSDCFSNSADSTISSVPPVEYIFIPVKTICDRNEERKDDTSTNTSPPPNHRSEAKKLTRQRSTKTEVKQKPVPSVLGRGKPIKRLSEKVKASKESRDLRVLEKQWDFVADVDKANEELSFYKDNRRKSGVSNKLKEYINSRKACEVIREVDELTGEEDIQWS